MEADDRISFQEIVEALKRRWYLLVAAPAVLVAVVFAVTLSGPRDYKATAVMFVGISKLRDSDVKSNASREGIRTVVNLIPRLVHAKELARKFKTGAEPYSVSADALWSGVLEAKVVKDTQLIHLSATTPDPALSRDMANYAAERAVSLYLNSGRADVDRTKAYLKNQVDGAKRRLNSTKDALLRFNEKFRLEELSGDIKLLLFQREQLDFMRFEISFRLKDSRQDDFLRKKEEVLKLLGDGAEFSKLKMAMDKNDNLLEHHRALSKKMLEMKSRLSAMLQATNGASRVDAPSSSRRKSTEAAGAGDIARAAAGLEKIRSEKRSLEDERKNLSTALPVLTVEIQVSMSRLKSLKTAMNDFRNASRAGTFSADERTWPEAPRKNAGANREKTSDAVFDAVSVKIVDEESRLAGLKEKEKRYQERIARIDAELLEASGTLRELEARRLLLRISRMSGEIKKIESEILSNRREIAERRARRSSLLAKLGALEDVSSGVEAPLSPASRSARPRDFGEAEYGGSAERENFSPNMLLSRLRTLDRGILTAEQLRHRDKLLSAQLKAVGENLNKKIIEEAKLTSLRNDLQLELSLAQASYSTISGHYDRADAFVQSGGTNLKIASRARMPHRPTPRYLIIKASLSFIVGLFLAVCAALFLEFRETAAARREPDGA